MQEKQKVFVVDDDHDARESVCALIKSMGIEVEGFDSAEAFLENVGTTQAGCIVTDVRLRGINGVELLETLNSKDYHLPVVVITAYASTPLTVRAMQGGAVTFLEKPCDDQQLWDAVRNALELGAKNFEFHKQKEKILNNIKTLTDAEAKVMDMVINGTPNKEIAASLNVSLRTIESRRHNVFKKMKVDSVAELVKVVIESGRQAQT